MAGTRVSLRCGSLLLFPRKGPFHTPVSPFLFIDARPPFWQKRRPRIAFQAAILRATDRSVHRKALFKRTPAFPRFRRFFPPGEPHPPVILSPFCYFLHFPMQVFLSQAVFFRRKWVLTSYFTAKTLTKVGIVCILNTVFRLVTKVTIQSALPQGSARAGNLFQEVRL